MSLARMIVIVVTLVVGLPLVIFGLSAMGLVGWIVAAALLPPAVLVALLRLGREPEGGEDR